MTGHGGRELRGEITGADLRHPDFFDAAYQDALAPGASAPVAENVANADTPKFMPRDLAPVDVTKPQPAGLTLARTSTAHLTQTGGDSSRFALDRGSISKRGPPAMP